MYNLIPEPKDIDFDDENPNEESIPTREGFDLFRAECEDLAKSFYRFKLEDDK